MDHCWIYSMQSNNLYHVFHELCHLDYKFGCQNSIFPSMVDTVTENSDVLQKKIYSSDNKAIKIFPLIAVLVKSTALTNVTICPVFR